MNVHKGARFVEQEPGGITRSLLRADGTGGPGKCGNGSDV